jgi:hypothetical protein
MLFIDIQYFIMHIMGQLFECKCLDVINTMSCKSQTTIEKVALNFMKEMVPGLLLTFSILSEELLTSMVYMGVKVMAYNGIYGDGVKVGVAIGIPDVLLSP